MHNTTSSFQGASAYVTSISFHWQKCKQVEENLQILPQLYPSLEFMFLLSISILLLQILDDVSNLSSLIL